MNQTLPLKEVREQLSELVSKVAYGDQKVVITKFGKPVAAIVNLKDYEKVMDPSKNYTKEEWDRGFALMDKARENAGKYAAEEVEDAIEKAIKEVREAKKKRV